MTVMNSSMNCTSYCCGFTAAASHAHIINMMDTVVFAVSIFALILNGIIILLA